MSTEACFVARGPGGGCSHMQNCRCRIGGAAERTVLEQWDKKNSHQSKEDSSQSGRVFKSIGLLQGLTKQGACRHISRRNGWNRNSACFQSEEPSVAECLGISLQICFPCGRPVQTHRTLPLCQAPSLRETCKHSNKQREKTCWGSARDQVHAPQTTLKMPWLLLQLRCYFWILWGAEDMKQGGGWLGLGAT